MPTTFNLAPIPKWNFLDIQGVALSNGTMKTFEANNRSLVKTVYADPAGTIPYPPIINFDAGGMAGPFYWASDSNYFIEIFDQYGNIRYSIPNYNAPNSGGGNITVINSTENFVSNGQFLYNVGTATPDGTTIKKLAATNPDGFIDTLAGNFGGDCFFHTRNGVGVIDTITFVKLALGDTSIESTPPFYCRYQCTSSGSGSTFNRFVMPLVAGSEAFQNQQMTFNFSAKSTSVQTVSVSLIQNFGSVSTASTGSSTNVETLIAAYSLSPTFVRYSTSFAIPSAGGNATGAIAQDSLYIAIDMPLNQVGDIGFTNLQVTEGNTPGPYIYRSKADVSSEVMVPRTGDVVQKFGIDTFWGVSASDGWLLLTNGLTIGNDASVATYKGKLTAKLYAFLYLNIADAFCPVSGGRTGITYATAVNDFMANKTLQLPTTDGRVLTGAGATAPGVLYGASTVTLVPANLPNASVSVGNVDGSTGFRVATAQANESINNLVSPGQLWLSTPFSILPPETAAKFYIKL